MSPRPRRRAQPPAKYSPQAVRSSRATGHRNKTKKKKVNKRKRRLSANMPTPRQIRKHLRHRTDVLHGRVEGQKKLIVDLKRQKNCAIRRDRDRKKICNDLGDRNVFLSKQLKTQEKTLRKQEQVLFEVGKQMLHEAREQKNTKAISSCLFAVFNNTSLFACLPAHTLTLCLHACHAGTGALGA